MLSNSPFVTVSETVFWIATGELRTGERLHNELWRTLGDRHGLRLASSQHSSPADPLGDAARDIFCAHCDGKIAIKGQNGKRAPTNLPRDVVAHDDATFNPFTNCVVSQGAKVTLWRNIRVRTSSIEDLFTIRAETALTGARTRKLAAAYDQRVALIQLEHTSGGLAGDSNVLQ